MFACLFLLPLLQAPQEPAAAPPVEPAATAQAEIVADSELPSVLADIPLKDRLTMPLRWGRVRFREGLISFSTYSARGAKADLDGILIDPARHSAALMALGCSKASGVRVTLESWAVGGGPLEQRAAILALGELGGQSMGFLQQLSESDDPLIGESALFALLRLDSPVADKFVQEIADDPTRQNSAQARLLQAFKAEPGTVRAPESVVLLFELRWDAALNYGLVGGKSRSQLRIEELESSPEFLNVLVLRSAENLSLAGVDDHILALLESGDLEAIRVAVLKMPRTLSQRFREGLWEPESLAEWTALLDAIDEGDANPDTLLLVRGALEHDPLQLRAAGLMAGMGDDSGSSLLLKALYEGDLETRINVARSLGRARDSRWPSELSKLRRSEDDSRLAMAALVAQMRMGYRQADVVVRSIVLDGEADQRIQLVEELLEVGSDPKIPALLEAAYPHLLGRVRLKVAAKLVTRGRVLPRAELLVALESGEERDLADSFIRALKQNPGLNELQAMASLFPAEDLEINIELALALIENNHAIGLSLLSRALWNPPLDLSSLAAGLMVRARGISVLHRQLATPPARVTVSGIRRVGFALGEWGGVEALEELASNRPSHDPALQGAYLGAMSARTQ